MQLSISLHDELLAQARRLLQMGRPAEAGHALAGLVRQQNVTPELLAEAHRRLGEIELHNERFRSARKHLSIAIALNADDAEAMLFYAEAAFCDPTIDQRKTLRAARRATQVSPAEPRCWVALGKYCLRFGKPHAALKALRQAIRLEPKQFEPIAGIVDSLMALGRLGEAERFLDLALFRVGHLAGLRDLKSRLRYEQTRHRRNADAEVEATVPFTLPASRGAVLNERSEPVRHDRKSLPMPNLLRMIPRPTPRRAQ